MLKSAYEIAMEGKSEAKNSYRTRYIPESDEQLEDDERKGFDFIPLDDCDYGDDPLPNEVNSIMIEDDEIDEEIDNKNPIEPKESKESMINKEADIDDGIPEAYWYGNFTSYSGFSRLNRAMVFGLSNKNVRVKIDMQETHCDINKSTLAELNILASNKLRLKSPKIFCATIPLKLVNGYNNILFTMMETSETLHPKYVDALNSYGEVWIPTQFGKDMCIENNVKSPIRVMPLGVDINRYKPSKNYHPIYNNLKSCVFLSVFKWGYRKGYDILLKAFMEEFSKDDDVSLLIVSRTDVIHKKSVITEDFKNICAAVGRPESDLPHVALYDSPVKERDMPRMYAGANAFVLISRGEGWGLPYYEAAATGLPVIASNCSAQTEILNHDNSFLVEPDGYVKAEIVGKLNKLAKHCGLYENQMFPDFREDAINELKSHFRYIYENYDDSLIKADKLRELVTNKYTWDVAVNKVYDRIIELQS
jgi:glycosyltransferase involved in cell wall biosynthesis